MIFLLPVNNGWITTNCYFFGNDAGRGFLIDPGAEGETILAFLKEKQLTAEKILITHGHCDHIGAAPFLARALGAPLFMRDAGKSYAENPYWNLSTLAGEEIRLEDVSYFCAGSRLMLDSDSKLELLTIPAPGHTADGTVFYSEACGAAFTGDTLFAGGRAAPTCLEAASASFSLRSGRCSTSFPRTPSSIPDTAPRLARA